MKSEDKTSALSCDETSSPFPLKGGIHGGIFFHEVSEAQRIFSRMSSEEAAVHRLCGETTGFFETPARSAKAGRLATVSVGKSGPPNSGTSMDPSQYCLVDTVIGEYTIV